MASSLMGVLEGYPRMEGELMGIISWEKEFLSPKDVNQHRWWLGCNAVVAHLCKFEEPDIVENGHQVFDELSKRLLTCDSFGKAQKSLTHMTKCAKTIGKDISGPFLIEGGTGQFEGIRRLLVHQLVLRYKSKKKEEQNDCPDLKVVELLEKLVDDDSSIVECYA